MQITTKMADLMLTSLHIYLPALLTLYNLATCKCEVPEENITGWLGHDDVRLPCNFTHQDVIVALYWSKEKDPTKAEEEDSTKASYFKKQLNSLEERFTLNEDFSLSISDLRVADEGRYLCQVEFESDRSLLKYQTLIVYARVSTPEIEQCDHKATGNESHTFCSMRTPNTHPFDLTCRATGFKPNVTLQWMSSVDTMQSNREPYQMKTLSDGTLEQKITIIVTAHPDMDQSYTCTVNGEATNGTERSSTITVRFDPEKFPTQFIIIFSVLGFFILIVFIAIITVLCRGATTRTIEELRKSIKDYTFKIPGSDDKATAKIGLYGEMGAGKSTFINSIEFAYNGERSQPTGARGDTGGGHSIIRSCLPLTDYISLFDNRGMRDFSLSYVDKYMKEISDEREAGTQTRLLDEEIHCVVFVYRHSDANKKEEAEKFLEKFSTELRQYFGYSAFVVVTHADSLSKETKADLKETFSPNCDKLWFLENYTDDIEDKEKSISFLKFLKAALHRCDVAIVNIERRKTQWEKKWFWQRWLGW